MRFNTLKKCIVAASFASASVSLNAADATYNVGFTTVPDITLIQIQAMDFGSFLGLANGSTCTMAVDTQADTNNKYPGDDLLLLASVGPDTAGTDAEKLTSCGTAGAADTGTYGIYEIQGIAGGQVKVTVNNSTGTDFNYTAAGCIGTYDGSGNGDTCIAVTGAQQTVTLAAAADTVGNAVGAGIPSPGVARIALGGTITTTSVHTAGQLLTETFVIDVTY